MENERRGGRPIYIERAGESDFGIAELAARFSKAGYGHWDEIFKLAPQELRIYTRDHSRNIPLRGELYERFMRFKSMLGAYRREMHNAETHKVEILESTNFERVFVVDDFPIAIIDTNSSLMVENLLLGIEAFVDTPENEGSANLKEEDLRKDIDFLNFYFGLGIELKVEGIRVDAEIPDNVRVVPVAVVDPRQIRRRPSGAA